MQECVLYARVSSKDQEREGYSIPAQLELLRAYALRNGMLVLKEYTEVETAKCPGREHFNEMVAFLKKRKKPACLLVEKTDRLQRNLRDYITVDELVTQHNVAIHKVKEGTILHQNVHSSERFMDLIRVGMAKQYIENLSEEVKKGHRQKVLQGGWITLAPYGYRNDKNTREIIVDADTSPMVIRAFQLYATGLYSLEATINQLQAEGYRYNSFSPRISRTKLHVMLQNPAYIGRIPYKGEIFDGTHPPLIDPATWAAVQRAFKKDNKPVAINRHDFTFRGLLTCGECGSAMVGELKKGRYTYYRCSARQRVGCGQRGYIQESALEAEVAAVFAGLLFPPDIKQRIREAVVDLHSAVEETANAEADKLNNRIKKLRAKRRTLYEDKCSGLIDEEMYREIDRDTLEEIMDLEARQANITQADTNLRDTADLMVELPELIAGEWIHLDTLGKQRILQIVQSNFFVKDGNPHLELKEAFTAFKQIKESIKKREWQDTVRTLLLLHSRNIREIHQALRA
jgi:site-specific DNA recombinase